MTPHLVRQFRQFRPGGCGYIRRHVAFVGKIHLRLEPGPQARQDVLPTGDQLKMRAAGAGCRQAPLGFRLGLDQLRQGFRLGQIDPAIGESPTRKLSRLSRPEAWLRTQMTDHRRDNGRASVSMQLHAVLAGEAVRARQKQGESAIDRFARHPQRS